MSGRSTSDADSGSSQRISVKASHEILAVDDNGTPVASAAVGLPSGEEVLTDADGVANFHAVTGDALRVEKDGTLGVDLTWGREVSRRIVLQRQRVLTVQVSTNSATHFRTWQCSQQIGGIRIGTLS